MAEESFPIIHDVIVIGAGPCGLGIASRLCEPSPSAIFTEDEHQRYHWIKKHGRKMALKNRRSGKVKQSKSVCHHRFSTLVLDATGNEWMNRWKSLFAAFDIHHLRSPMFWHVDPSDRDAMLAMAHNEGREKDLFELKNCVGKEVSKHLRRARAKCRNPLHHAVVDVDERDRHDYFTPPTDLFLQHCKSIADRYGLCGDIVRKETLEDVEYREVPQLSPDDKIFTLRTNTGVHYARTVVLAVGPGNKPRLPQVPGIAPDAPQVCHAMHIKEFPATIVQERIKARKTTNVLVVGGGLTSAQLSDLAIRRGVTKVWQLMRGPCKVKLFDVDLSWMGKFRNVEQAYFHGADSDADRLQHILKARDGGSVTPTYHKILKRHVANGKVDLRLFTSLTGAEFDADKGLWTVKTEPAIDDIPAFDHIYFATGIQSDFFALPYLQNLLREYPIEGHGGLPCIDEDLKWSDDVPFFVAGRFAGLRLGPAAGNLGGARIGAERIAWGIEDVLPRRDENGNAVGDDEAEDERLQFVTGRVNRFRSLCLDDKDE
ncbi:FAD binding domain-containing protein [Plectosphaerella cucumerina]|uniref:FAD binding domain-containing protein n=1 Tax=Plectosphaerella cucumerina TaxID=40658 RepID=A0A8K0TQT1_9PEZI|nr:FAD binding domain-containing protein [Plectosphaerella cucumerina]